MQIIITGDKQYRMTLTPEEARIFVKGMYETFRRIPPLVYQTRMGPQRKTVEGVAQALETALKE